MRLKHGFVAFAVAPRWAAAGIVADPRQIARLLAEAEEAGNVLATGFSVPIPAMDGIEAMLLRLDKGMALTEADVQAIARFLRSAAQLKQYMAREAELAPRVASYAQALQELTALREELERCVHNDFIVDQASVGLERIRKKIRTLEDRLKRKMETVVQKYWSYLQDDVPTDRGGRAVLPVKREHRRLVPGKLARPGATMRSRSP